MILLNEKRVQILALRIKRYYIALKKYYVDSALELQKKTAINPKDHNLSTHEFKQIIGDTKVPSNELTEEEEKSLIERLSTSDS